MLYETEEQFINLLNALRVELSKAISNGSDYVTIYSPHPHCPGDKITTSIAEAEVGEEMIFESGNSVFPLRFKRIDVENYINSH